MNESHIVYLLHIHDRNSTLKCPMAKQFECVDFTASNQTIVLSDPANKPKHKKFDARSETITLERFGWPKSR